MESVEQYFVALSPSHRFDDNLLGLAAARLDKDDYDMRLLLAGEMPRVIALYQSRETAVALVKDLMALGLSAIAGSNAYLRQKSLRGFTAHSLQLGEKDILFRSASDETLRLSGDDVFLILEGILTTSVPKKENQNQKMLNLPVTLALGGIPVWRKSQSTPVPTCETERFLRFYRRTSPEPVVEISSGGFDYSFLGEKKSLSSTENFKTTIATLRSVFPKAVYDNRLMRNSPTDASFFSPQEMLERNSRLIYLFYISSQTDRTGL